MLLDERFLAEKPGGNMELHYQTITELAPRLASKAVSPVAVTTATVDIIPTLCDLDGGVNRPKRVLLR
jgi:hypothetical protein